MLLDSLCAEGEAACPCPHTPAPLKIFSQQKQSALVSPAKLQLCLSPEPCPAGYLAMLRWLWTLTGSPAVLGSGRSFTVITSQGTQCWPGKAWLLPNALTLRFNQGGNHLCAIKEEALLQDELWQNWIFWESYNFKTTFQPHKRQSSTLTFLPSILAIWTLSSSPRLQKGSFGICSSQLNAMRTKKVLGHTWSPKRVREERIPLEPPHKAARKGRRLESFWGQSGFAFS